MVLFLLCFYLGDHAGLIVNSEENKGLCALDETLFANALMSSCDLKALISCHQTKNSGCCCPVPVERQKFGTT